MARIPAVVVGVMWVLLASSSAGADGGAPPKPETDAEKAQAALAPTAAERLAQPIRLRGACSGLEIIEWRPVAQLPKETGPTPRSIERLRAVCEHVIARYPAFLKSEGLTFAKRPLEGRLSLMPWNSQLEGAAPRNLGDNEGRFRVHRLSHLAGLYDPVTHSVYLRNDVLLPTGGGNPYFETTFAHELAHLMNDQWRVTMSTEGLALPFGSDEALARSFPLALGLQTEGESEETNSALMTGEPPWFALKTSPLK